MNAPIKFYLASCYLKILGDFAEFLQRSQQKVVSVELVWSSILIPDEINLYDGEGSKALIRLLIITLWVCNIE